MVAPVSLAASGLAQDPDTPEGNGVVMMVHGHVQPSPTEPTPAPPVHEAFMTTPEGDEGVFHAIPYSVEDEVPVVVDETELHVDPAGPAATFSVEANGDTVGNPVCDEETSPPGHEGPIEACQVFRVSTDRFAPADAAELTLEGTLDGEAIDEPTTPPRTCSCTWASTARP
jgi:hypothetical protein